MSADHKRKLLADWSCPVCFDTVSEQCIPAVMNGCVPFAHVVCMSCLNLLLEQKQALCPECRAPFASIRPLAAFVDKSDPVIADALAKKAKVVTLEDKLAALDISDEQTKLRVAYVAKRIVKSLQTDYYRIQGAVFSYSTHVPDFDKDHVCLRVIDTARVLRVRHDSRRLNQYLNNVTASIIPYLGELFPQCLFKARSYKSRTRMYMGLRIHKR